MKATGPQVWCACCAQNVEKDTDMVCIVARGNGAIDVRLDDQGAGYETPLIEKKYVRVDHLWAFLQDSLQGATEPLLLNKSPYSRPLPQTAGRHGKVEW
jgi:hypothetical protein